jgi:hypothetical protein
MGTHQSVTANFVENIPPDTTITSQPPPRTNSTCATFAFTASEPGCTFQCQLDSGAWAACSSPATYCNLADGGHTFSVRATDPAGNVGLPATASWTVDTVPPVTNASPAGGTYTSAQTVTLTANETATIYYTLDGSTPTTMSPVYTGPLTISANTTLQYFAMDLAGNPEGVNARTYSFTYSLTVTVGGAGGGKVTILPPGMEMTGGSISMPFTSGTQVELTATSVAGSIFSGWGGACSGMAGCSVTMNAAKSVTASFAATVQGAYDNAPAGSAVTMTLPGTATPEPLILNRDVTVTLAGVLTQISVSSGVLIAENVVIQ